MKQFIIICLTVVLSIIPSGCAGTSVAPSKGAGFSLIEAIEQTAQKITEDLPIGSRVAIVAFESESANLSDYIMEELAGALFDRNVEVADRQNLEYVNKELGFQMSGDVSEETALFIGKFLGAQLIITGQLRDLGDTYRCQISTIEAEKAVRASVARLSVRNDTEMRQMVTALANQKTTTKTAKYGISKDTVPKTSGTFLDRGILFASQNEYEKALADFNEALKLNPDLSAAYVMRGKVLYAKGLKTNDFNEVDSSTRMVTHRLTGDDAREFEQAIADYTMALRLDPNNAKIYVVRAKAYLALGDNSKGYSDLEAALRRDPNDEYAKWNIGVVRFMLGIGD
jgi:tetratricopeptide (TPR) repeat protein